MSSSDAPFTFSAQQLESIVRESAQTAGVLAEVVRQQQLQSSGVKQENERLKTRIEDLEQEISNMKKNNVLDAPPHTAEPLHPRPSEPTPPAPRPLSKRNLVVCIDGTSNQFSTRNTNVVELYSRLVRDNNQLTFYNSGIGTYATPSWWSWKYAKQVVANKIDLAIAWRFEPILLSAYRWLSENYRPGDKIYLFGFSRGAYQVRTLAAMIHYVGLLRKGNLDQIPFAYELYAGTKRVRNADIGLMCDHFKRTFSEKNVNVHFLGAWDTVSSVGLFRTKTLPGTNNGMEFVTYFRHALALHERRVKFLQENARGGMGPDEERTKSVEGRPPHTKEVWFAGSHSDIGGGLVQNLAMNQYGPSLRWMLLEASTAGIRLTDGAPEQWEGDPEIHNSMSWVWYIFEGLPFARLTYKNEKSLTWWPHICRPRNIQYNQLIHSTVFDVKRNEQWRARLPGGQSWVELTASRYMVEDDPYSAAKQLLDKINWHREDSAKLQEHVNSLKLLSSTGPGVKSLQSLPNIKDAIVTFLSLHQKIPDESLSKVISLLADAGLKRKDDYDVARNRYSNTQLRLIVEWSEQGNKIGELLGALFAPAQIRQPIIHAASVKNVVYMPDGKHIASGCDDHYVRIWNIRTGEIVGKPMLGHLHAVSVDGAWIASMSCDGKIHIWDVATRATINLLEGYNADVESVAFSPDKSRVVSGFNDHTIRVWDVATARTVVGPIEGHTRWVLSVVFSSEGSMIISGALDYTVCAWAAQTGERLWLVEMLSVVSSVACSSDASRIVAGCWGGSVHVLDSQTGAELVQYTGHEFKINSVAFSPDGTKVASASDDDTVRLWDSRTAVLHDVFRGHRHGVTSVAFSPDGNHIATTSYDKTVRIWDATGEWKRL